MAGNTWLLIFNGMRMTRVHRGKNMNIFHLAVLKWMNMDDFCHVRNVFLPQWEEEVSLRLQNMYIVWD